MTNKGTKLLQECKGDLRYIINKLKNVENSIRTDFYNIGNKECADCLDGVIKRYQKALDTLDSIDTGLFERLDEEARGIITEVLNKLYIC